MGYYMKIGNVPYNLSACQATCQPFKTPDRLKILAVQNDRMTGCSYKFRFSCNCPETKNLCFRLNLPINRTAVLFTVRETMAKNAHPPAPIGQDFGTWSQYTTGSQHEKSASGRDVKGGGVGKITQNKPEDNAPLCPNCQKPFEKQRRDQRFCKPGCRTYYSRKRAKALIPALWQAFGIGYDGAVSMLEKVGAAVVAAHLEKFGYHYDGDEWQKHED